MKIVLKSKIKRSSNTSFLCRKEVIITNNISIGIEYGVVYCNLRKIMINNHISIYKLSKLTGLKYDVIMRYYNDTVTRYDAIVLAKLCYTLNCSISDILKYEV